MLKGFKEILVVAVLILSICCNTTIVNAQSSFDKTNTTVSQTKKTTTKKVKLSSKAKKNKTTNSVKNKISDSTTYPNQATVITKETKVTTTIKSTWKKGSNIKTVTTTVLTKVTTKTTKRFQGQLSIDTLAPKAQNSVRSAFKNLGFKLNINPYVKYAGITSYSNRTITLKYADDSVYHELGHFISFVADNACDTTNFKKIYNAEKGKYTGNNKVYVTKDSSEYFAESYRDYVLRNATLKSSRPKTYSAIQSALAKLTSQQINKVKNQYWMIWNRV